MRNAKGMLALSLLLSASLACATFANIQNGVQQIQSAATQLPGMLTAAPTMLGPMETAAAQYTPQAGGSSSGGAQPLSLDNIKIVLQMTQQFKFKDGTVDGQPAGIAELTDAGATSFPAIKNGFSAAFIGDPKSLSRVVVTAPRSDAQDTVDQGITVDNMVLTGTLPPDVQVSFLTWLTENYAGVQVSGKLDKTIGNMQFTLERTSTTETLTVTPLK